MERFGKMDSCFGFGMMGRIDGVQQRGFGYSRTPAKSETLAPSPTAPRSAIRIGPVPQSGPQTEATDEPTRSMPEFRLRGHVSMNWPQIYTTQSGTLYSTYDK